MAAYTGTVTISGKAGELGQQYTALLSYVSGTTPLADADTITWEDVIPNGGAKVVSVKYFSNELDTGATPTGTFIIGDGTDVDAYLTTVNLGLPAQLPANGSQLHYFGNGASIGTNVTTLRDFVLTVNAAVATGANPNIKIEVLLEGI